MADLKTVPFTGLVERNADALNSLLEAVTLQGFFYLDLRESEASATLVDVEKCYQIGREFFALSLDEKLKFDIDVLGPHKLNGYKPMGRNAGIAKGKQDGFEAYLVSRDGICGPVAAKEDIELPEILKTQMRFFQRFMADFGHIGHVILECLDEIIGTVAPERYQSTHRPDRPSSSALGILRYPELKAETSKLGQSAHTDVGSLTLLFCSQPGLQILKPSSGKWTYVAPKIGHTIVNVGDSLRFLSGGRLRSCLHRVIPLVEDDVTERYSCAYFLRPELDAEFCDDEGRVWKSVDWHDRKYVAFRASVAEQEKSSVLTGKAGYIGSWYGKESPEL